MLLIGGLIGTTFGVWLFTQLRALGQLDLTIGLSYLILLSAVGDHDDRGEHARDHARARSGKPVEIRRPGSHMWIHGLPLKMRFETSKIFVSSDPICVIGFLIEIHRRRSWASEADFLLVPSTDLSDAGSRAPAS